MADKEHRQKKFIAAYVERGADKKSAASDTGVPIRTVQRWFNSDEEFQLQIEEVFSEIEGSLMQEAFRRAMGGSDNLLKFLLKAVNPTLFDERCRQQSYVSAMNEQRAIDVGNDSVDIREILVDLQKMDPFIDYAPVLSQSDKD